MRNARAWMLGMLMMLTGALVGADDAQLVDNPAYHSWDDAPIGTAVHAAGTIETQGGKGSLKVSKKLVERTPDSLTFELSSTFIDLDDPDGKEVKQPASSQTVQAKISPDRINVPEEIDGKATVVGNETITVGGKSYECSVIKIEGTRAGAVKVEMRRWNCDEVIGRTVRSETTMEKDGQKVMTKLEVTSIEKPTGKSE